MRPRINAQAVAHLALEVADLDNTMQLLIELLGFQPVGAEGYAGDDLEWLPGRDGLAQARERQMRLTMVVLQLGEFRINLQAATAPLTQLRFDHLAVAAREQGFAEIMAILRGQSHEILEQYTIPDKRVMFRTASGLVIEVYSKEVYQ